MCQQHNIYNHAISIVRTISWFLILGGGSLDIFDILNSIHVGLVLGKSISYESLWSVWLGVFAYKVLHLGFDNLLFVDKEVLLITCFNCYLDSLSYHWSRKNNMRWSTTFFYSIFKCHRAYFPILFWHYYYSATLPFLNQSNLIIII